MALDSDLPAEDPLLLLLSTNTITYQEFCTDMPYTNRQRVKHACEPCKARKRRCDGHEPCASCIRYDYTCEFISRSRGRLDCTRSSRRGLKSPDQQTPHSKTDQNEVESRSRSPDQLDLSSGTAFPRILGQELTQGGNVSVEMGSWNLGLRDDPSSNIMDITRVLPLRDMDSLAKIFLSKVNPVYALFLPTSLHHAISLRWNHSGCDGSHDSIFYGVAAMGSLFTAGHEKEKDFVRRAREELEAASENKAPSLDDVAGWVLRTLYLRITRGPCASWLASCTGMHMIGHIKAHKSTGSNYSDVTQTSIFLDDREAKQRLVWIASTLNTWISFEYGQPRVNLRDFHSEIPDFAHFPDLNCLLKLHETSQKLDPNYPSSMISLSSVFDNIENMHTNSPVICLSQSNLALSFYRKMRFIHPSLSGNTSSRLIKLGNLGVQAAVMLATEHSPWWHVANVPFQFLCTLLSIDNRESLSHVGSVIRSIKKIAQDFETSTMRKIVESADLLVSLSEYKKTKDLSALKEGLQDSGCMESSHRTSPDMDIVPGLDLDLDWDAFLSDDFLLLGGHKMGLDI